MTPLVGCVILLALLRQSLSQLVRYLYLTFNHIISLSTKVVTISNVPILYFVIVCIFSNLLNNAIKPNSCPCQLPELLLGRMFGELISIMYKHGKQEGFESVHEDLAGD